VRAARASAVTNVIKNVLNACYVHGTAEHVMAMPVRILVVRLMLEDSSRFWNP
jgi:hypothetical protein